MKQERNNRLVKAYDRMMEKLSELMEQSEESLENLQKNLGKARNHIAEVEDVTEEEAEKISGYLKRDLRHAGEYLKSTGRELSDWLYMDLELIEWNLLDLFLSVADRSQLERMQLEEEISHGDEYHSGEIMGPGVIVCDECGEELHFQSTGHIPPCPKCHHGVFTRKSR